MKPIEILNFLSIEECDNIFKILENFDLMDAPTSYDINKHIQNENFNFNKRKIAYIDDTLFLELSTKILNKLNELNIFNGIKYDTIGNYSFNKYSEGDFLNYHYDGAEIDNGATITLVIELSNNFKGGEFCYLLNDIEHILKTEKGNLYIFESTTMHKVKPITNGIRYSMNCWPKSKIKKTLL
jgi:predicted 2-oxoglutarate/Fe(II)-dependent dioxygenase YbiX